MNRLRLSAIFAEKAKETMERLKEKMTDWLREGFSGGERLKVTAFGDSLAMAQIEGTDFRLRGGKCPTGQWHHIFLHVYEGELRLTVNGDRIGFDKPVYVDFIAGINWEDITFAGSYRVCVVMAEQYFFMEATAAMRVKVFEGIMRFAQSPFAPLNTGDNERLEKLEGVLAVAMSETYSLFGREQLQSLVCAWQYEWWNIFSRYQQAARTGCASHWDSLVLHFFYLAHTHCREHHDVKWYANQLGVSPCALSVTLKRLYRKTASAILEEMLVSEAKVCLRNPSLSVQNVAEMLSFSDQSAFGKFFKRCCGTSPSAFKKKCLEQSIS